MLVAYSREKEVECEILPLHYLHIPDHELARSFLVPKNSPLTHIHPPSHLSPFSSSTIVLAPVVGGVAGTTVIPLLIATVLAYCSTGYANDELYHPLVKICVGKFCSLLVSC